jgi:ribonuclease HII
VVAAACVIDGVVDIEGIMDSKATTEQSRVDTFERLISTPGVIYDVIRIEHDEIDEINILQASLKAMRLATEGVLRKMHERQGKGGDAGCSIEEQCIALVDGNRVPADMPVETAFVIKVSEHSIQRNCLVAVT